jgi:hypothetical protein
MLRSGRDSFRSFATYAVLCALYGCGTSSSATPGDAGGDSNGGGQDGAAADAPGRPPEGGGDDGPAGGEGGPPSDGSTVTEGGNVSEGGGGDDAGDAGSQGNGYFGKVVFEQYTEGANVYTYVFAKFAPTGVLPSETACPNGSIQSGACCYVSPAVIDAGAAGLVSAGTLNITDNGLSIESMPYASGGYSTVSTTQALWLASDNLGAVAPGDTIPAFSSGVTAPEVLAGVVPAQGSTAQVSVSAPWTVTWTAGSAGSKVSASLNASGDGYVLCVADDSVGTLTMPASLLGHFKSTDVGSLAISRVASSTIMVDGATIETSALMGAGVSIQFAP